ncbi:HD domain-containing protein [Rhodoferax fermentans]|uniref:5'-deoxynucleotidase n=1 Tax=Rhodoferax fermentans TaxID=28066 RepID=A0A1T1ASZ2_RHOFE|nr:HD domain-containing protein [Rhodoferax fermentans]MBK1682337.1 HD domain-containing protein [Rhodoferax fermentans]OOV07220.1 phosphohydrolase [Rhodoferax fermentans]
MRDADLQGRLAFIQAAEQLKSVLRCAYTATGRQESTPEHSWRLCLLAMVLQDSLGPLDFERVLKMCVIHDLGEALHGDVPAIAQGAGSHKSESERHDLIDLMAPLPAQLQTELLGLWDDYEQAASAEARAVKALDKLETLIQHNQGQNPPDFDYAFNLSYGQQYTAADPLFAQLRRLVDAQTQQRLAAATQSPSP